LWLTLGAAGAVAASRPPCFALTYGPNDYAVCEVDLRRHRLELFWRGPDGQAFGSLERLVESVNRPDRPLLFAMNAGMYHPDLRPVGLYVENGRELVRANTADGPGNFHLKPNGVFYVSGQRAGILETSRYLTQHPRADLATQSGPMLVIRGRIHPKISEQGTSRKLRNGVGVRDSHTVVFAISNRPVTFAEFAHLFRDRLGCADALYLDGSISSLYAPSLGRADFLLPAGPIVGAFARGRS
jgi:uncharacterized protein YigE (DUF2233 family)